MGAFIFQAFPFSTRLTQPFLDSPLHSPLVSLTGRRSMFPPLRWLRESFPKDTLLLPPWSGVKFSLLILNHTLGVQLAHLQFWRIKNGGTLTWLSSVTGSAHSHNPSAPLSSPQVQSPFWSFPLWGLLLLFSFKFILYTALLSFPSSIEHLVFKWKRFRHRLL